MGRNLNIHATFGSRNAIIISPRIEFLSKVSERFNIKEDEIEIYDKKTAKRVRIDSLYDLMKVEIRKKNWKQSSRSATASTPFTVTPSTPFRVTPSTPSSPRSSQIIQKLTENALLTGSERCYLMDLVRNDGSMVEQTETTNEKPSVKKVRNVKIQVDLQKLIGVKSAETQTDGELETPKPNKRPLPTNDIMYQSKRLACKEKIDPVAAQKLMDRLFHERRDFILNELPIVSFVKEKYPLLFSLSEVRNEIDRIFHRGRCEQFIKNIRKYAKAILSMAKEDDPLLHLTKKKMASYQTKIQKRYAMEVGSLLILSSLLYEERKYLKLTDQSVENPTLPYIEADIELKEIFFDEHLFKIYVEGNLLCEATDFKEAVLCLVGSYYLFNIQYPDSNWNTFAVFEQVYLEKSDSDTDDLDDFALQIIRLLRLKAQASDAKSHHDS